MLGQAYRGARPSRSPERRRGEKDKKKPAMRPVTSSFRREHTDRPSQAFRSNPGSVLLSHTASRAVPSAPRSLTSEFGMGSGVASSRSPPETVDRVFPRVAPSHALNR